MNKVFTGGVFLLFLVVFSPSLHAGLGSGTLSGSNPTGGFGTSTSTTTTTTSSNSTGGFGTVTGPDPMPLGPPPPPPDPTPLDGGASLLIAAAVGFGARKIYRDIKNK